MTQYVFSWASRTFVEVLKETPYFYAIKDLDGVNTLVVKDGTELVVNKGEH